MHHITQTQTDHWAPSLSNVRLKLEALAASSDPRAAQARGALAALGLSSASVQPLDVARTKLGAIAASTDPRAARARRALEALDASPAPSLESIVPKLRAEAAGSGPKARAARRALIALHPEEMTQAEAREHDARLERRISALEGNVRGGRIASAPAPTSERARACAEMDRRMGLTPKTLGVVREGTVHRFGVLGGAASAASPTPAARAGFPHSRAKPPHDDQRARDLAAMDARMGLGTGEPGVRRVGNVVQFGFF